MAVDDDLIRKNPFEFMLATVVVNDSVTREAITRKEEKTFLKFLQKRNIIQQLLQEYDIETAEDIQDALKDLLGGTIKEMMEAEMDDHLGYQKSERSDSDDYRNGYKSKRVNSSYGSMDIDVPQDRKSTFKPQIVKKRQKDISDIDQKIISMYAKGMTTRQISETIEDIYDFEASEGFISDVTDKILPQIEDWQNRPLDEVYPILYIDAIHYSVRDNGMIRKLAAYVILGINIEGKKEVLSITVGDNESSKYWLSVLNELKNRGVKDILIICADGLSGIKEAIAAAFPKTEYQRCIVHQVRNTLKYVPDKDRKAFASDLKTIYHASDEEKARLALDRVTEKWTAKYPNSMKRWYDNWDAIIPIFKFSPDVRTPKGKRRSLSLREMEKKIQADHFEQIATNGGNMTVLELVEKYTSTKTGVRPTTVAGYGTVINLLKKDPFGKRRIDTVWISDAKCWLIHLQQVEKKSYSSIHSIRGVLRPAFQLAVDDDLIRKNPFQFQLMEVKQK